MYRIDLAIKPDFFLLPGMLHMPISPIIVLDHVLCVYVTGFLLFHDFNILLYATFESEE